MIAITIDTEWAPEHVLSDTLELLDEYEVSATLFSTHNDSLEASNHERALHPNFFKEEKESKILDQLCSIYPDSKGLRSHGLFINTSLREHYPEYGIEYESNYMQYRVSNLKPFWMLDGTLQFPVYWMDDAWFGLKDSSFPSIPKLLSGDGLKVFDFHPPHIYFNTPSEKYYETHKNEYWEESTPIERVRATEKGVRDVFINMLEYIDTQGIDTHTLETLAEKHASQSPFEEITDQ